MDCYRCLIQWGFTVFDPAYYKNVNFTLPLSVNGTFCAFSTGYDAKGSTFLWHSMSHFNNVNVGVTGFVFDSRYTFTGLGYLAVCWQKQWGKILGDTVNLKIINFPVSFNECFGGLALFNGDPVAAAEYATITDITNTNFKIYMYANNAGTGYANANIFYLFLGAQPQWGYYTAAVGAIYTDVTTPVSFSRCFLAASIDILLAASTTWPGTTQTVWNINASTANKLRFIWAKAPIELDGAVWFGIFIQTVGILCWQKQCNIPYTVQFCMDCSWQCSRF